MEGASPHLQCDYGVEEMCLDASRLPSDPEHSTLRSLQMLIEDLPRALGRLREDVTGDGRDARRRLQFEPFRGGRLDVAPTPRARPTHSPRRRFHPDQTIQP